MIRFVRRAEILPSPNIWYHPDAYELENHAQDVGGELWRTLRAEVDWAGKDVVDVGCGDGFHLPLFAETARSVVGVEPHPPLVRRARRRVNEITGVNVKQGAAQRLPLASASVDLVHARTAYFFGRGCEPGLNEADRVLRKGGALAIVDLDVRHQPYGDWMRADLPDYDPADVDRFFAEQGFRCLRVETIWRFENLAAAESALRIEFSPSVAERAIGEVVRRNGAGPARPLTVPVGYRVLVREKPSGLVRLTRPAHSAGPDSSISPRIP
ncbi:class I SAM-dependent methyltransferase [Amycolatopsis marina]|uniref:class I SAM-dependent methyltransferase n=1 Tax=Amycolatopsis marina TaxID=490629 RepID=UPI001FEB3444|nr:class I SAM-dependent methyltransferase [Amycolatopsis marina]